LGRTIVLVGETDAQQVFARRLVRKFFVGTRK